MRISPLLLAAFAAVAAQAPSPARVGEASSASFEVRFFHDVDKSSFEILDLQFASPTHGLALGDMITRGKDQSTGALTTDGGKHWSLVKLPKESRSVFFLDERHGWLVASGGIHFSGDGGRSWSRVARLKNVVRVHFLDAQRGFAVGAPKKVWVSTDGGKRWTEVAAAAEPKADPERSVYSWIEFQSPTHGFIVGWHAPERPGSNPSAYPDWMYPERAKSRVQWPSLSLLLQTVDGGQTWKTSSASILGRVIRLRTVPSGRGLTLVEFQHSFDWPSEVYALDVRLNTTTRCFRERDRAITDVALLPNGTAYLAGYEPAGALTTLPIPGKVKILTSTDFRRWDEVEVDYRAVATRVLLATPPGGSVWAATSNGMILELVSR